MIKSKSLRGVSFAAIILLLAVMFVSHPTAVEAKPLAQNCTLTGWTDTAPGYTLFPINYIANPGSSWQHLTGQTGAFDETLSQINGGGKATFDFYCSSAFIYEYKKGPNQGIARIFIGSTPVIDIDLYSPTVQLRVSTLIHVNGQGVISITRSGLKNPSSTGAGINLDALNVL